MHFVAASLLSSDSSLISHSTLVCFPVLCFSCLRGTPLSAQDESNRKGGKWLVRIKKAATSRCWENVLLAMVGEQFGVSAGDELCGCVVSVKGTDDSISGALGWNGRHLMRAQYYRVTE